MNLRLKIKSFAKSIASRCVKNAIETTSVTFQVTHYRYFTTTESRFYEFVQFGIVLDIGIHSGFR